MVAGITVKNIPPGCTKQDLLKHFKSRRHGGGTIDYVLFPLVGDESQAFVTFRDSKGTYYLHPIYASCYVINYLKFCICM